MQSEFYTHFPYVPSLPLKMFNSIFDSILTDPHSFSFTDHLTLADVCKKIKSKTFDGKKHIQQKDFHIHFP